MIKKILLLSLFAISCTFETPTEFTEKALGEIAFLEDRTTTTFKNVLDTYQGKKVVIDVWASWCADCIKGLPQVKKLQKEYPEVVFLFLSVDKNQGAWQRGIQRFNIEGEHYNIPKGMSDSDLADFLNLNWIPRYLVIDEKGKISLFKATKSSDKNIIEALK